ncbi:hypothetical protein B9Z55_012767 [Caenorhabditis nigoni]|uniref:F-box domain-containing protein n=1 Tax=Caenorhabditis nigoni TaxID=1611254 RepID=A0A2G5TYP4_9PELO|nr:hypothetical protein B9Z55_012767 [Caenorhabditis nigoni]
MSSNTGKSSKEPIFKTNWCDIPAEIKLKCIRKLEFKERWSLRDTAKAERSLVDSQKIKFSSGYLMSNNYSCLSVTLVSENGNIAFSEYLKNEKNVFKLLKFIWKVGIFENLKISRGYIIFDDVHDSDDLFTENAELLSYTEKSTAKNIDLEALNKENVIFILQKLENGVETIKLGRKLNGPLDDIISNSHIQNARYWHIQKLRDRTDLIFKIAQMWIDKNAEIGSTFQVCFDYYKTRSEFAKHFSDRIVSVTHERVRIRTNSPDRHILLEHGIIDHCHISQNFRLMVISAEMKESEYEKNCEKWIYYLNSVPYKEGDSDAESDYYYDDY